MKSEPNTTPAPEHSGAMPRALSIVVAEWEREVPKKWREIRNAKGHWISKHSPQAGHAEDLRRRRETSQQVMTWTVEWFKARGHRIECVIMPDGESLAIREANNQEHATFADLL